MSSVFLTTHYYRFVPERMGNPDQFFTMQPYYVSQEEFDSCDTTLGQAIITVATTEVFIVDDKYLQPGSNYFIGKSPILFCTAKDA